MKNAKSQTQTSVEDSVTFISTGLQQALCTKVPCINHFMDPNSPHTTLSQSETAICDLGMTTWPLVISLAQTETEQCRNTLLQELHK